MSETYKYRAFISYNHRDRYWGEWLRKALESYRIPRRLVGTEGRDGPIPARLFPIYRDREETPTSADLSEQIQTALAQSAYLIVICSPNAVASRWVNEEILTFKRLGRDNRILTVIVDGEPNADDKPPILGADGQPLRECFPQVLRFHLGADGALGPERTEPVAADARPQGDGKENAKLKLIAGLLGVGYDDLKQRDHEARRRRFGRGFALTVGALALAAVALLAFYAYQLAESRSAAEIARDDYNRGNYAAASDAALQGLPAGRGMLFDLSSAEAVSMASIAAYQNRRIYGISVSSQVAFSADRRIAVLCDGSAVALWDLDAGKLIERIALETPVTIAAPTGIAFTARTYRLALIDSDGRLWFGDAAPVAGRNPAELRLRAAGHIAMAVDTLSRAVFSPDGQRLLVVGRHGLALLNGKSGQPAVSPVSAAETLIWAGFGADGADVLAVTATGAWIWTPGAKTMARLAFFDGTAAVAFPGGPAPMRAMIATSAGVQIVDLEIGRITKVSPDADVTNGDFTPDGGFATLDASGVAVLYTAAGQRVRRVRVTPKPASGFAILDHDRILTWPRQAAIGDAIEVWDASRGPYLGTLKTVDGPLSTVRFWQNRLLTFSRSGVMRLWQLVPQRNMGVLTTLPPEAGSDDVWRFTSIDIVPETGAIRLTSTTQTFAWRGDSGALVASGQTPAGGLALREQSIMSDMLAARAQSRDFWPFGPGRDITEVRDENWAMNDLTSSRPVAIFADMNVATPIGPKSDWVWPQVFGDVAAVADRNGDVHFWRLPPVRTARQLARDLCENARGNILPAACSRSGLLDGDVWQSVMVRLFGGLVLLGLMVAPHVLLSALIWRGGPWNLSLRVVAAVAIFAAPALRHGMAGFFNGGLNDAITIWFFSLFLALPGLLGFGIRGTFSAVAEAPATLRLTSPRHLHIVPSALWAYCQPRSRSPNKKRRA